MEPESPYDTNNFDCQYCGVDEISRPIDTVYILSLNVQSIQAKFAELRDLIVSLSLANSLPEFIVLQEIWRFPDTADFKIPGYQNLIYRQRTKAQGGGVGIFVKLGINFTIDTAASIFHERIYESLVGVAEFDNNKKIVVGSVYRPGTPHPDMALSDQNGIFFDLISNQLELLASKNKPIFLLGDFNIDVLKYGKEALSTDYVDILFSSGFIQTVIRPTRCTNNSATLIDHCITNFSCDKFFSRILTTNISDHFPVMHGVPFSSKKRPTPEKKTRLFNKINIDRFKSNIAGINWETLNEFEDVDSMYNYFLENFLVLHDLHFPLQTQKYNKNLYPREPWFTRALLVSRCEKKWLDKMAASSRTPENLLKYKTYRNVYNRLLRAAKKLYFEDRLAKCQSNAKTTWQTIKQAINMKPKKNHESIVNINFGDRKITDGKTIAQVFNEYFATAPHLITQDIHKVCQAVINDDTDNNDLPTFDLYNKPVSHDEVFAAFKGLEPKKTPDYNDISMFLLKECSYQLINPLTNIFNKSFSTGTFPNKMKTARVVPIFKSGDNSNPDNYRPISLLSNFSKILEKIIANRLVCFLEENDIISNCQFGFRKGHSTVHPMTLLVVILKKRLIRVILIS